MTEIMNTTPKKNRSTTLVRNTLDMYPTCDGGKYRWPWQQWKLSRENMHKMHAYACGSPTDAMTCPCHAYGEMQGKELALGTSWAASLMTLRSWMQMHKDRNCFMFRYSDINLQSS